MSEIKVGVLHQKLSAAAQIARGNRFQDERSPVDIRQELQKSPCFQTDAQQVIDFAQDHGRYDDLIALAFQGSAKTAMGGIPPIIQAVDSTRVSDYRQRRNRAASLSSALR